MIYRILGAIVLALFVLGSGITAAVFNITDLAAQVLIGASFGITGGALGSLIWRLGDDW